eukprot:6932589-Pyramimonas_sp.AAC.1
MLQRIVDALSWRGSRESVPLRARRRLTTISPCWTAGLRRAHRGPPCPPWSANGGRKGFADSRSHVHDRLVEWIVHLALRGQLLFFALENAAGILPTASASGAGSQRYVDK